MPYFTVNSTAVPAYDAFCSAPVRCGKSACPGAGASSLRDGPRDCQRARVLLEITSMPMVWSVVFCVEVGFLGAMRAVCCVSRDGRCTPFSRPPPV